MKSSPILALIFFLLLSSVFTSKAADDIWRAPLEAGRNYVFVIAPNSVSPDGSHDDIILTPQPIRARVIARDGNTWIEIQHVSLEDGKVVPSSNEPFWLNLNHVVAYRELSISKK
jgi:hypothetical protein